MSSLPSIDRPSSTRFFYFNHPPTTQTYTLSLHDALPISPVRGCMVIRPNGYGIWERMQRRLDDMFKATGDRKSTRLNSSHITISYAVFCLKKKNSTLIAIVVVTVTDDISVHMDRMISVIF